MARLDRKKRKTRSKAVKIFTQKSKFLNLMYVNFILVAHLLADRYGLYEMIMELIKNYK